MANDIIDEEINFIIETLKRAKNAKHYHELDGLVETASRKMEELVTTVNIEGTQMEAASDNDRKHRRGFKDSLSEEDKEKLHDMKTRKQVEVYNEDDDFASDF